VDIAQPRDVEEGAGKIDGIRLFTIDDLRQVNEKTMNDRRAEAERAAEFVNEELELFIRQLHRKSADDCIAALHTWAEAVRVRERDKALARLGSTDERTAGVIDDLSRVLTKKILTDATASIRACAEEGDRDAAEALVQALTRGSTADLQNGKEMPV
jgi:glutamyl-tRNA reductase